MNKKTITIFGGSLPRPGEKAYQNAQVLGGLIARAGYRVQTGGYSGIMEAVSKGAVENGGYAIGITCIDLEVWRSLPPNPYLSEEIRFQTLRDRMYALIDNCDLAIALPGGIGTLTEIAAMWSSLQIEEISGRPLILVGTGWRDTLAVMLERQDRYVADRHRQLLSFAPDVEAAFHMADRFLKDFGHVGDLS